MPMFHTPPPLGLYIHLPWCIQKCPYCDFNSHAVKDNLPEAAYVAALLDEMKERAVFIQDRPIISIFFGGGTPSLFSGHAIHTILSAISNHFTLTPNIEITLEANPGTIETTRFADFKSAGVNRISLGVQSFQDEKLIKLGRIHDAHQAKFAIDAAIKTGFDRINLDLMFGLPDQTTEDALFDLKTALDFGCTHLSWYHLTLEPNTFFHHMPPVLPNEDDIWRMQEAGMAVLESANMKQYEVSAFAKDNHFCKHNLNYWAFGDYLGIGAGAHSKITDVSKQTVSRFAITKHPKDYLLKEKRDALNISLIRDADLPFEFMLNALRLTDGFETSLFTERTGLPISQIENILHAAVNKKLIEKNAAFIKPTEHGKRYLNNLMGMFLV